MRKACPVRSIVCVTHQETKHAAEKNIVHHAADYAWAASNQDQASLPLPGSTWVRISLSSCSTFCVHAAVTSRWTPASNLNQTSWSILNRRTQACRFRQSPQVFRLETERGEEAAVCVLSRSAPQQDFLNIDLFKIGLSAEHRIYLATQYRLTPSEIEIAGQLFGGASASDISRHRGCTIATIRSQLHSIFEKTYTKGQTSLFRLLMDTPPARSSFRNDYAKNAPYHPEDVFGLSTAEANIATELSKGNSPVGIAATRLSSLHTVRSQIKRINEKTNCRNINDLVRIVLIAPWLCNVCNYSNLCF